MAVARERVASLLLAEGLRAGGGAPVAARAAAELARAAARALLAPLLGATCARLAACLRRAFEVASEGPSPTSGAARCMQMAQRMASAPNARHHNLQGHTLQWQGQVAMGLHGQKLLMLVLLTRSERADALSATGGAAEALRPYVAFHAELRTAFQQFVGRLEAQSRELVRSPCKEILGSCLPCLNHIFCSANECMCISLKHCCPSCLFLMKG